MIALPVEAAVDLSPSLLGMYRKTMVIERDLDDQSKRYGVDPHTVRAVLLQESGGNGHLVSSAGARGYFQVMPRTFRSLGVRTNIEAGIKYLAQLQRRFKREDYAVAAYNVGPGRVGGMRPLPLETLQYVIAVSSYRSVLQQHEAEVVRQASSLKVDRVNSGDSWAALARRHDVDEGVLRLYNPFLATGALTAGALVSVPPSTTDSPVEIEGSNVYYRSRVGDSHVSLAYAFGVDPEAFRRANRLWRLQQLPPGVRLRLSLPDDSPFRRSGLREARDSASAPVPPRVASKRPPVPSRATRPRSSSRVHRVRARETLGGIARRYQTSTQRLMEANSLQSSRIEAGAVLRIPES